MTFSPDVLDPADPYDHQLLEHVRPPDWVNPQPEGLYNLVVIGAGTAGLVTAAIAAGLGARVALIERNLMGGDCLNVGCVPSKALIRASRARIDAEEASRFGVALSTDTTQDFSAVMKRMRRIRSELSHVDSAQRFKELGVDVYIGEGQFIGPDSVAVGETVLRFSRAAICTGARAAVPTINGLEQAGFLTNESVFSLNTLPKRLAVVGGGPIGCELAQAFARFGSAVTLIERESQLLPREDKDAATVLQQQMTDDGVKFVFNAKIETVVGNESTKHIHYKTNDNIGELVVDDILLAVGRAPNIEGLHLETAAVAFQRSGVTVDKHLRTTNKRIYAAGDICFPLKFTHAADAMAQMVVQNALFPHPFGLGSASTDSLLIPWCTYTDPEVAHVGITNTDATKQDVDVETFTQPLNTIDRAVIDGKDNGFVRVIVKRNTDKIVGATIVAADAGNLISEITVAMKADVGLSTIGATIHPYPTQADALRKTAHQMRKVRFTERQKILLRKFFAWCR